MHMMTKMYTILLLSDRDFRHGLFYTNILKIKRFILKSARKHTKGKVFCGQEPPSGESTTTECGVNYQLLQ